MIPTSRARCLRLFTSPRILCSSLSGVPVPLEFGARTGLENTDDRPAKRARGNRFKAAKNCMLLRPPMADSITWLAFLSWRGGAGTATGGACLNPCAMPSLLVFVFFVFYFLVAGSPTRHHQTTGT